MEKSKASPRSGIKVFEWPVKSLFEARITGRGFKKGAVGNLFVLGSKAKNAQLKAVLPPGISAWQDPMDEAKAVFSGSCQEGPLFILRNRDVEKDPEPFGYLEGSSYARSRDIVGGIWPQMEACGVSQWCVHYLGTDESESLGVLVGLELASYRYMPKKEKTGVKSADLKFVLEGFSDVVIAQAQALGKATNLARHLVNTPANILNPKTYADVVTKLFRSHSSTRVEVWSGERLVKEKMNLMLAVGGAAEEGPRMVHIRYRPKGAKNRPIAMVGKGITFDSGGLDIKPPSSMRLMKKDMGGSASVVGIAYWVMLSKLKLNMDFYLGLAENAIAGNAYRPGDVFTARNGLRVEIHNTDAEGRLVLADTLDVAVSKKGKDKPELVIDLATLTGAARVALGTTIGALFTNRNELIHDLAQAGQSRGDLVWPLPLYEAYAGQMRSAFADVNHCSSGRFGGAITAALFLKKFVGDLPWI